MQYEGKVNLNDLPVKLIENEDKKIDIWIGYKDDPKDKVCTPLEILKTQFQHVELKETKHRDFDYRLKNDVENYGVEIRYKKHWLENIKISYDEDELPDFIQATENAFYLKTSDGVFEFSDKVSKNNNQDRKPLNEIDIDIQIQPLKTVKPYALYLPKELIDNNPQPADFSYIMDVDSDQQIFDIIYIYLIDNEYKIISDTAGFSDSDVITLKIK